MSRQVLVGMAAAMVFIQGCGTIPRSTGAMQLGPETYRIRARASMGNVSDSQKMAFAEAKQHCESQQRQMVVVSTETDNDYGPFEVTFRCLTPGDPDLVRPNLEKAPDTVIKIR